MLCPEPLCDATVPCALALPYFWGPCGPSATPWAPQLLAGCRAPSSSGWGDAGQVLPFAGSHLPGRGDWDTQAELPADAPCVHGLGASRRSLCPTFKGSPRGQLVVVVLPSLTTFVFYLAYSVFSLTEFLFKIPLSEAGFHIGVYFPCTGVPGR